MVQNACEQEIGLASIDSPPSFPLSPQPALPHLHPSPFCLALLLPLTRILGLTPFLAYARTSSIDPWATLLHLTLSSIPQPFPSLPWLFSHPRQAIPPDCNRPCLAGNDLLVSNKAMRI